MVAVASPQAPVLRFVRCSDVGRGYNPSTTPWSPSPYTGEAWCGGFIADSRVMRRGCRGGQFAQQMDGRPLVWCVAALWVGEQSLRHLRCHPRPPQSGVSTRSQSEGSSHHKGRLWCGGFMVHSRIVRRRTIPTSPTVPPPFAQGRLWHGAFKVCSRVMRRGVGRGMVADTGAVRHRVAETA